MDLSRGCLVTTGCNRRDVVGRKRQGRRPANLYGITASSLLLALYVPTHGRSRESELASLQSMQGGKPLLQYSQRPEALIRVGGKVGYLPGRNHRPFPPLRYPSHWPSLGCLALPRPGVGPCGLSAALLTTSIEPDVDAVVADPTYVGTSSSTKQASLSTAV